MLLAWSRARDIGKLPIMHRTAPHDKEKEIQPTATALLRLNNPGLQEGQSEPALETEAYQQGPRLSSHQAQL